MKVNSIEIPVNVLEELEPYLDQLPKHVVRGNKLQACSPFRIDKKPSFAVNLDNGTFIDSGNDDPEYYKGNFVKLLAYLRHESYEDALQYLMDKYSLVLQDVDTLSLQLNLEQDKKPYKTFNWNDDLKHLHFRSKYLGTRGISEKVQRLFCVGFDREMKAVAMCWLDADGNIINVKFRSTTGKQFAYMQDGQLVRNHIYGLYQCIRYGYKDVALVEAEIDCMYLWSNGIPAIAVGHSGITPTQLKLLQRHVTAITIASDNDGAGNRFRKQLKEMLPKHFTTYDIDMPIGCKDVNEVSPEQIKLTFSQRKPIVFDNLLKITL